MSTQDSDTQDSDTQDSDTQGYEIAIATFRQVLAGVTPGQIASATPCASFDVGQLVDHTIGTQHMVADALQDKPFNMTGVEEPAPYGPEQIAPVGAPAADRLAAFLGRVV